MHLSSEGFFHRASLVEHRTMRQSEQEAGHWHQAISRAGSSLFRSPPAFELLQARQEDAQVISCEIQKDLAAMVGRESGEAGARLPLHAMG